jgi:hypothetical protein
MTEAAGSRSASGREIPHGVQTSGVVAVPVVDVWSDITPRKINKDWDQLYLDSVDASLLATGVTERELARAPKAVTTKMYEAMGQS